VPFFHTRMRRGLGVFLTFEEHPRRSFQMMYHPFVRPVLPGLDLEAHEIAGWSSMHLREIVQVVF